MPSSPACSRRWGSAATAPSSAKMNARVCGHLADAHRATAVGGLAPIAGVPEFSAIQWRSSAVTADTDSARERTVDQELPWPANDPFGVRASTLNGSVTSPRRLRSDCATVTVGGSGLTEAAKAAASVRPTGSPVERPEATPDRAKMTPGSAAAERCDAAVTMAAARARATSPSRRAPRATAPHRPRRDGTAGSDRSSRGRTRRRGRPSGSCRARSRRSASDNGR